ncbi:MAG TPA: hypothetical protein EYP35_02140 [Desulfobacterales bacterium]|nr:hypothetical protein [Desulfobacterales bacterium]
MIDQLYFLRIFAIVLIINSHLYEMWPIPQMAFGGHLGNSIFYLLSGYGLALSNNRKKLPILQWYKVRFVKVIFMLLIVFSIVDIGNMDRFVRHIFDDIIWNKKVQLAYFLPVLWGLYLLFPLVRKLSLMKKGYLIVITLFVSFFLFKYRIDGYVDIPTNMPSMDIFFSLNALICFVVGVVLHDSKIVDYLYINNNKNNIFFIFLFILFLSQFIHQFIISSMLEFIYVNFYLNIVSVVAIFILIFRVGFDINPFRNVVFDLANSSLAIYIVQFRIIPLVEESSIAFPYNVVIVYSYSMLFGYAIYKFSSACMGYKIIYQYYRQK